MRITESKDGEDGVHFDFRVQRELRREKKSQRKRKPQKQQPSVRSNLFGQQARLELKSGLSAGFLVFSNFFAVFPFYVEDVRSGLLNLVF